MSADDLPALRTVAVPVGVLDPEELAALKAWPHGWEVFAASEWEALELGEVPSWSLVAVYRGLPAPEGLDASIEWSHVAPHLVAVAMDADGSWWLLSGDLECGEMRWLAEYAAEATGFASFAPGTCKPEDWRKSLVWRPGYGPKQESEG